MFVMLVPVVGAVLAALALGGSWRGLARPIAWWQLGVAAILVELALTSSPVASHPLVLAWGHWAWTGTLGCVLVVLARNAATREGRARTAWAAAAGGVALNLTVVLANGGYMPLSADAANASGIAADVAARSAFRRDVAVDKQTRLVWLADVLPTPRWMPRAGVLSVGDLLLIAGVAGSAFGATYGAGSRRDRLAI